ncbi:MAG: flap endonuclease [Candidatus Dormibacteraeota bacterium]|nr:flap endonuclease [Candidatus Dormibacteraeota bacterium]
MLVDGSSLIFRAFYGVPGSVRSPSGRQINAVRGFLDTLARLVSTRNPRHVAVAADDDWRPDWRVALIPQYKAQRTAEPVPPLLEPQFPVIWDHLDAIGVDHAGLPDYEAEDVVATWAAEATGTVEIASGDRDLFALVEEGRVSVLYPERSGLALVDETEVTRRYGVPGRRYPDFAVLRGDPSDGLPGLRGVGPAAAASLLRAHGDIEGVIANARLSDEQRDYLRRAVQIVMPQRSLPIALPHGSRRGYPAEPERLTELMREYGTDSPVAHLVQALNDVVAQPAQSSPA